MKRRNFLKQFGSLTAVSAFLGPALLQAKEKNKKGKLPNVVYILADDMGIGDVMALGTKSKIKTPYLDQLVREGMTFTDAHTNSGVCTPTRYGILTGRYAWRTREKQGVLQGHSPHLINTERETVASFMRKQGYATACVGKWHLGMDWQSNDGRPVGKTNPSNCDFSAPIKNGPNALGFDYYYGISASLNMDPHLYIENDKAQFTKLLHIKDKTQFKSIGMIGAKPGRVDENFKQDQVMGTFASKAVEWIKKSTKESNNPFFIYIPLNSPHAPVVPNENFKGRSELSIYADFVMETDHTVGQIMKALEEIGQKDNTLLIFVTDNGVSPSSKLPVNQEKGHFSSSIYRGLKGSLYEGGHRVPYIARWPEKVKAGTKNNTLVCSTDLLATLSDITGGVYHPQYGEDSISFYDSLISQGNTNISESNRKSVIHHSDSGIFSIRDLNWKLILHPKGGTRRKNPKGPPVKNPGPIQLFNMKNDPIETTNLAEEMPEKVIELKKLLAKQIFSGRTTPGPRTPNEKGRKPWSQVDTLRQYFK